MSSDAEREALRRVWRAFGCDPNPDDYKPRVRAVMWNQVVEMAEESTAQSWRIYRENQQLIAERSRPVSDQEVNEAAHVLWQADDSEMETSWLSNRNYYMETARAALEAAAKVRAQGGNHE